MTEQEYRKRRAELAELIDICDWQCKWPESNATWRYYDERLGVYRDELTALDKQWAEFGDK